MARAKRKTARSKQAGTNGHASSNGHVSDGTLVFDIKGGQFDGQRIEMDAMVVKMASGPLEDKLTIEGESMQSTPEFAIALDSRLKGLGYTSTPSIAIAAWQRASEYFAEQQKKTNSQPSLATGTDSGPGD
jgi:hypothetical protein